MSNQEIISQALNSDVEEQWKVELLKRDKLLKSGELKTVSYEEFFSED